jgi:2-iminoacetate synthase ThiH
MLTREQVVERWNSDDLVALGMEADVVRKHLHPEGVVSYTLHAEERLLEHVFRGTDSIEERIEVLQGLRKQQQQNPAIQVFRPLVEPTATGVEYLKTVALSRIYLDNVPHMQAVWNLFGLKVAQLSLRFGADDLGVLEGAATEEELRRIIRDAGFIPKQRDALFRTYSIT